MSTNKNVGNYKKKENEIESMKTEKQEIISIHRLEIGASNSNSSPTARQHASGTRSTARTLFAIGHSGS
jgi:hypothetical protein